MTLKYTKLPQNIPNDYNVYQMATNIPKDRKVGRPNCFKIYQHLQLQDPPKFTQIGIFGLKIYHLATLLTTRIKPPFC
jgi:hypothetical protein